MFKQEVTKMLLDKIDSASKRIRAIEDDCRKFSVAPEANGVYTALVGYRKGLQESLENLRSMNGSKSNN
tara:strand:- start:282 stop:488 length:207 start_codon:yes stop_codon:yes gene_type:complete